MPAAQASISKPFHSAFFKMAENALEEVLSGLIMLMNSQRKANTMFAPCINTPSLLKLKVMDNIFEFFSFN
jgi:hypothetical protein